MPTRKQLFGFFGILALSVALWQLDTTKINGDTQTELKQVKSKAALPLTRLSDQPAEKVPSNPPVYSGTLGVMPTPPPDFIPNNLLSDPKVREDLLSAIRKQKKAGMLSFHHNWFESLQLTPIQVELLSDRIIEYDVGIASMMLPSSSDGKFPRPPALETIATNRAEFIETLRKEFGNQTADSYTVEFPGPPPGRALQAPPTLIDGQPEAIRSKP